MFYICVLCLWEVTFFENMNLHDNVLSAVSRLLSLHFLPNFSMLLLRLWAMGNVVSIFNQMSGTWSNFQLKVVIANRRKRFLGFTCYIYGRTFSSVGIKVICLVIPTSRFESHLYRVIFFLPGWKSI